MQAEILHDAEGFEALGVAWEEVAAAAGVGLFLSHRWLTAWWRAYHGVDELWVVVVRDGARFVAGWPLHLRAPRAGGLKASELRVLGDLGGAQRSVLCRVEDLEAASAALVDGLTAARGWDLVDAPIISGVVGDALERAAVARGHKIDRPETVGRAYADLPPPERWSEFVDGRRPARALEAARYVLAEPTRGLDELLRLLRKEWAAREATSPAADPQAVRFLGEVVPQLAAEGRAHVGLLTFDGGGAGAIAADLVVVDGPRHVQLLRGADPEHAAAGVIDQLALGSLQAAAERGARRFEFADDDSPFKSGRGRALRVRLWNTTPAARLHRGVESLRGAMRPEPKVWPQPRATGAGQVALRALHKLRVATPDLVQRAMARMAAYATLHLYRGELFTRDVRDAGELSLRLFTRDEFEGLGDAARDAFAARLDLQLGYCRQKWERGDTVVLAEVGGRPAGIVWCARAAVYVPDIGREVRPGVGECYIHDVYVHPDERGRQVAPAMLDFLARELRGRDVYRAWALIERSNAASTRAFEKAAYASVADVIYARMGLASRLIVRPPDPEARAFLGLP
jgi:ribosomal protein S18 acetylase RimI-like enzyme